MKAFRVSGTFLMKPEWQHFSKEIAANDKDHAVEIALSDLGSRHRVKRTNIRIEGVEELDPKDIEDPVVRMRTAM